MFQIESFAKQQNRADPDTTCLQIVHYSSLFRFELNSTATPNGGAQKLAKLETMPCMILNQLQPKFAAK